MSDDERRKALETIVRERPYALQVMTFQVLDDLAGTIEDLNEKMGVTKRERPHLSYEAPGSFLGPSTFPQPPSIERPSTPQSVRLQTYYREHKFTSFAYVTSSPTTKDVVNDLKFPASPDLLIVSPTTEAYIEFDRDIDTKTSPSILSNYAFTVPLKPTFIMVTAVNTAGSLKIWAFWAPVVR